MVPPKNLWLVAIAAMLAIGCEETPQMEIDANSTTNPTQYSRQIPDDAVADDGQGTQSVSEQVANTEDDAAGLSQEDSLGGAYNLEEFQGQTVLLVFAGSPEVPAYEKLRSSWKGNEQKDAVILVESLLKGRSPEAAKTLADGESQVMRSRYGIQPPQFKAVLIGPNGEAIEEWEEAVNAEQVLEAMNADSSTANAEATDPE